MDINLPTIAFFTLRPIAVNEELTFDYNKRNDPEYGMQDSDESSDDMDTDDDRRKYKYSSTDAVLNKMKTHLVCKCGSSKCRKTIL